MERSFLFFFISLFFFSCQKDKQATIAGNWKEISVYTQDNSGTFYWTGPPKFPLHLTLNEDGRYSAFNDVPAGHGTYRYNYSTRQLSFEDFSGSVDTRLVSVLDDDYLIIDYSSGGVVVYRQKFLRSSY